MSVDPPLPAAEIARFLAQHPGFLNEHADLFSTITVPHPRQPHVIPLGERQNLLLRDQLQHLTAQLTELRHQAARNERITAQLHAWLASLLAEADAQALAPNFVCGLVEEFGLSGATLIAWSPAVHVHAGPNGTPAQARAPLSPEALAALQQYATALARPLCLDAHNTDAALAPLSVDDAAGSLAIVPLHARLAPETDGDDTVVSVGLLRLTDASPTRYVPDMDTLFLKRIGHLASALLHRLQQTAVQA